MKKYILSAFLVVTFLAYVVHQRVTLSDTTSVSAPQYVVDTTPSPTATPVSLMTPSSPPTQITTTAPPTPVPTQGPTPTPKVTGKFKDGTYKGSVEDAYYGNVQVQAVITGGRLTNVVFLDYPQDRETSREINGQAMPILIQEAITAQSAKVDGVSGASATSPAFVKSLTNALNQAM